MSGPPSETAIGSDKHQYFSHEQVKGVIGGLSLAMFLAALDQTIVAIALYSIARDLDGTALMPWLISGYLVVATVATPVYGKLSDLYGRWPVLATAIGIYLGASLLSALAQTMPQLLAFRLLQGLGGGGLIVLVQTVIADIVPRQQRGRYQAWLSGVFAVAALAGPVVGGLLTEYVSWRAIFVLNLPLGIAAYLMTRRGLAGLRHANRRGSIDFIGAGLLGLTLTGLMLALMLLGQGLSWSSAPVLALAATSLLIGAAFVWQEQRAPEPIMPLQLFGNRTVMICALVVGLNFLVMYGAIVILPLALQTIGNASADAMAIASLPFTLGVPLGSYVSGKVMLTGMRHKLLLTGGSLLTATGVAAFAVIDLRIGWPVSLAMLVTGMGIGATIPGSIIAIQASVSSGQVGIATATSGLFRTLGGAIGIALLSAVLFSRLREQTPGAKAISLRDTSAATMLESFSDPVLSQAFHAAFLTALPIALIAVASSLCLPAFNKR